MAKNKNITRNQNHGDDDDASSKKKVKICDNDNEGPWSDLNHHVLYLVMMKLGVVDYLSFGGVCKSWRSLAVSNRNTFMESKPPMKMCISWRIKVKICYLEDFEGRKFKTNFHTSTSGACVGLTYGYLIFLRSGTRDFWLVNPITRHELYFTGFPINDHFHAKYARAILVFSLSIGGWVFIVMCKCAKQIWFSIAGTGSWNHVSCTSFFSDLRAFNGKIYALLCKPRSHLCELYEVRLNPETKLTLLETKNSLKPSQFFASSELVSSGENIYVMDRAPPSGNIYTKDGTSKYRYRFQELDFGEMKWVLHEKTIGESASFLSSLKHGVADKFHFWEAQLWEIRGQGLLLGHNTGDMLKLIELKKSTSSTANMWYFPHECLNVDLLDE